MGFLLFLKFVARISDLLAWPLIPLVCPLYASIQAIEKNSLSDSKKCLTYWVVSGLIMLFQVPFAGIVNWIPYWPYVKLMFNFWFVVDHFEGAVYAYDHFIRPCFSVDFQTFVYWLRLKCEEFGTGNSDSFLLHAKRFVEENGSDGLEKLILDKRKCENPKLALGENYSVQSENIKENTERNRVELIDSCIVQTGCKSISATENKPTAPENKPITEAKVVVESSEVPQPSIASNTQKEWTCALCQVCASSEITLQHHLKGRRHRAKEETIKKSTRTEPKIKQRPCKTQKEEPLLAKSVAADITDTESSVPVEAPTIWSCGICQIYTSKETVIQEHFQGKKHKSKKKEFLAKHIVDTNNSSPMVKLSDLWCKKCKLQCNSLSMLADHLRGKRHLEGSTRTL